ncbi:LacI family DNA-binding transcriptional regulator [Paenibacillus eucommiae]|uniref:DNA-binding LacI/PurR family transcriptional regulator n=1 Tax=Paenibacillus eucommiae TaxID=1355755 RepID=A0ABS4IWM5_9BACL|nr:LacI family DNA-binding transcriptional regulator [Paenibacillus eucommiae]MBP1991989.1 DNA-binding LacI/PurR family transcriptional regulator [Paenibacillus eucommiae]
MNIGKNRKPTIGDVAREAGVSMATVSNVINRRSVPLTADTISKVEQAVQRLGYRRNAMAANLSSRKSNELGLIIPNFGGYYGRFAEELEHQVHGFGYHLSVFSSNGMNPDLERRHMELLLQRRADGLICHGLAMSVDTTRQIVGEGTPLVIFNGWGWPSDVASIAVNLDFPGASAEAVRYLLQQGCRSVFYAADRLAPGANAQREQGFAEGVKRCEARAVGAFGVSDYDGNQIEQAGQIDQIDQIEQIVSAILDVGELGVELFLDQVLQLSDRRSPIGIYAYSDAWALRLLSECHARGLRVPDEIKLIGMDNELFSQASYPAITTFDMPVQRQTHLIACCLLQQLGEELAPEALALLSEARSTAAGGREILLPLTLLPRRSTELSGNAE